MMDDENDSELGGKMTFLEHLDEFRRRLIRIVLYIAVGFLVCWFFSDKIYEFISRPIKPLLGVNGKLVFTHPTDAFSMYMRVAIFASIFFAAPLIIHQIWLFIAPGLYRKEKRFALPFIASSMVLFYSGCAFAYYEVLPPAYKFLINFGDQFQPLIKIDEYWDLTSTITLGFGAIFQMPVIIGFLSLFGIITPKFLWKNFRWAVLIIFIIAAIISPTPDAVTQCVYAGPMIGLYAVSIVVSFFFKRRRDKREKELWGEDTK